jgi:hypothetical protein
MDFLSDFRLCRKTLSSYYIASMFSFYLFGLSKNLVLTWYNWFSSFIANFTEDGLQNNTATWFVFFLSCFSITLLIRHFVIQPLGFFVEEEDAPKWELWILLFLVLGGYIYNLNQIFLQPMPSWLPNFLVSMMGGIKPDQIISTWNWAPWLWNIGPVVFLFVRTKLDFKLG